MADVTMTPQVAIQRLIDEAFVLRQAFWVMALNLDTRGVLPMDTLADLIEDHCRRVGETDGAATAAADLVKELRFDKSEPPPSLNLVIDNSSSTE